jgi:hypothetical protein
MEKEPCKCVECENRKEQDLQAEESNFAILVSLVPMLTIMFFNTIGLF